MARLLLISALFIAPLAARADGSGPNFDLEAIAGAGPGTSTSIDRLWLYNDPTRLAAPGKAIGLMRFSYGSGDSLTRPLSANVGAAGALLEAGGELGLWRGISAFVLGAESQDPAGAARAGAMAGVRWSLLPNAISATQLVLSGGLLRELKGGAGAWGRIALGQDLGRARLAASVHAERVFDSARDSVDVMVTAGASMPLAGNVRAGVEYAGQDLESTFGDDTEGGARHVLGPTLATTLWGNRLSLAGGPAIALGPGQGRVLGRIALACQF